MTSQNNTAKYFRNALAWHMDRHSTSVKSLCDKTGVSRDVINKLRARENSSTTIENAILIAAFYGKSVTQFMQLKKVSDAERIANLLALLSASEAQLLEAQIQGILNRKVD